MTALALAAPHEAGIASGLLSTFHEFDAAGGAAIVSCAAAVSLTSGTEAGFDSTFLVAGITAAIGAVFLTALVPGRTADEAPRVAKAPAQP